jgi:hypothetical protein
VSVAPDGDGEPVREVILVEADDAKPLLADWLSEFSTSELRPENSRLKRRGGRFPGRLSCRLAATWG